MQPAQTQVSEITSDAHGLNKHTPSLQIIFQDSDSVDENLVRESIKSKGDLLLSKMGSEMSLDGSCSGSRFLDLDDDVNLSLADSHSHSIERFNKVEKVKIFIDEGRKLLLSTKYESAFAILQNALLLLSEIKEHPSYLGLTVHCKLEIARLFIKQDMRKEATVHLTQILEIDNKCAEAKELLSAIQHDI